MYNKKKNNKFSVIQIVFIVLILFFVVRGFRYIFSSESRSKYEVSEGTIVNDRKYTGIIIRQEEVARSPVAGYVNFYMREGKRVAVGDKVFIIDETGKINNVISAQRSELSKLDIEHVKNIKKKLSDFSRSYSNKSFYNVYDIKYEIDADLLEYTNLRDLKNIENITATENASYLSSSAEFSGIVSYNIDGFEDREAGSIVKADFDKSKYALERVMPGSLKDKDAPIYKIISSDTWNIVFELDKEDELTYRDKNSVKVNFKSKGISEVADLSTFTGTDGINYGLLTFDKYMIHFIGDRFIEFDIELESAEGLKIPQKAVVDLSFLTVPEEYLTRGGNGIDEGFLKEVTKDNGVSVEYVPTEIYSSKDGILYIMEKNGRGIATDDYLVQPGSNNKYKVGARESLKGVFNVNKGYAIFKQIDVLKDNEEYYIVKKNTKYGISVYDHILLDTQGVNEGDFIN